jgi:hypothetical protein
MDAHSRNLAYIFEPSIRFIAPLFQRPYVWNKEKNWVPLWESIRAAADRRSKGIPMRPHFLGAIVLDQLQIPTGEVDCRQIIDGQQRLTTLQLLLAAARDVSLAAGSTAYQEAFKRLTENFLPSAGSPLSTHKVWPTNRDREHFHRVMTAGGLQKVLELYPDGDSNGGGELIPAAYVYFHHNIRDLLLDGGSPLEERLQLLRETLRQDLVLVAIDLDNRDDAQTIFETLNALGTPLLPADLVKNYLFRKAEEEGINIEDLYERHWKAFDDQSKYWREELRQGRLQRPRIDLFLQHFLTLKRQEEITVTELFSSYKDYSEKRAPDPAEVHICILREYADVFRAFDTFPETTREGLFFYRLEQLDTQTVKPVLLEVFRQKLPPEERLRILMDLESYLVRRAACGLTYSGYNRLFVDLIQVLSKEGFSSSTVRPFLLSRSGPTGKWPTDDDLKDTLLSKEVYQSVKRAYLRVFLEGIERELQVEDRRAEKIQLKEKLTIEHVMPIKWRTHWPLPDHTDKEVEKKRDVLIHTLGNLTLVTKRLNPSLSNAAWQKKRGALERHTVLAMNRRLLEEKSWDEGRIQTRGETLLEVVKKIWPHPESRPRQV